jgi:hypothetical protein
VLVDPAWTTTAGPGDQTNHAAVTLADGRLLVAGGGPSTSVQIWSSGAFAMGASMAAARSQATATRLTDGRVLVAGGVTATAELYDPVAGTWSAAAPMSVSRQNHRAVLLTDGSVLVTGGDGAGSTERYVPASNSWVAPAGNLGSARAGHSATLLPDGRVLVVGGTGVLPPTTTRIFSLAAGWSAGPSVGESRQNHVAALLSNGKVVVAGGEDIPNAPGAIASVEQFDPANDTWSPAAAMPVPSRSAAVVPFGGASKMYVIGGRTGGGATANTWVYDGASGMWSDGAAMNRTRMQHTANLVAGGQILVVGGGPAEIQPPCDIQCVDFGCACSPGTCLAGTCVDGRCCSTPCDGPCEACSAAKKGSGADGVCGPIADGSDPDDECATQGPETCGTIGSCDGALACRLYAAGTECVAASCATPTLAAPASTCDGVGTCVTPPTMSCPPGYPCVGSACATSCATSADCIDGFACIGSLCVKKANGDACNEAGECASGLCSDGVCCNEACTGQCESCAATGTMGLCVQVKGPPIGKPACAGTGSCAGVCDEEPEACTFPSGSCGDGMTCSNGECIQNEPVCVDGGSASLSPAGETTPCTPYLCDPVSGTCLQACTVSAQCGDQFACVHEQCIDAGGGTTGAAGGGAGADDGCGCRAAGARVPAGRAAALLLAALTLAARRRRDERA